MTEQPNTFYDGAPPPKSCLRMLCIPPFPASQPEEFIFDRFVFGLVPPPISDQWTDWSWGYVFADSEQVARDVALEVIKERVHDWLDASRVGKVVLRPVDRAQLLEMAEGMW